MAERILPGLGLTGFWDLGSNDWKDANDANIRVLSALVQASALDYVSDLPSNPADGDIYLLDAAHPTNANAVAIRDNGAWVFITPRAGCIVFNVASSSHVQYVGGMWSPLNSTITPSEIRRAISVPPTTISGATHALELDDENQYLRLTNASGCIVTIPTDLSVAFEIGAVITMRQSTAATCVISAASGVILNLPGGILSSTVEFLEQGSVVQAKKINSNEWDIIGGTA